MPMSRASPAAVFARRPWPRRGPRGTTVKDVSGPPSAATTSSDQPVGVRGQQHLHGRRSYRTGRRPGRGHGPGRGGGGPRSSPARSWTSPASSGTSAERPAVEQRRRRAPAPARPPRPAPAARPRCATARRRPGSPAAAASAARGLGRGAVAERRVDPVGHAGEPGRCPARPAGRRTTPPRSPCRGGARRRHVAGGVGPQQADDDLGAVGGTRASMPAKAWKKATASASTSEPTTSPIARSNGCVAALTTRMPRRAGSISSRNSRWSRKRASTPGASRKSRALRLGGVSTMTRSNRSSSCSWCSVSAAMYSWVPLSAPEMLR